MTSPLERVRESCERVAANALHVRIDDRAVASFANTLATTEVPAPRANPADTLIGPDEDVVAYVLILDAVNFGSGYAPSLKNKVDGSLYYTVASALRSRFMSAGPLSASDLARLGYQEITTLFPLEGPPDVVKALQEQFTHSLNELGEFTLSRFGGRYVGLVVDARGSADRLIDTLIQMSSFNDAAHYRGGIVAFYKRAQLAVADLWMRLRGKPFGNFEDIGRLTAFADNAVPHVLHADGILIYDSLLSENINRGAIIAAGSEEEVEIRACAVTAVERIARTIILRGKNATAVAIDALLWRRAHDLGYAKLPRHLTKTIFY